MITCAQDADRQQYDVVIGLPSFNEADSIARVTQAADEGAATYFAGLRCLLLNADCLSNDGTRDAFAATRTRADKRSITTALPAAGKGVALSAVFEHVVASGARYCITLDTDLETITPAWIGTFAAALLADAQFVAPRYRRHRFDGTITNLVCHPIIAAVHAINIRQPIGGDFAFSAAAARLFCEAAASWPAEAATYGIDILMTTASIQAGLRMAEAELPPKVHKPSLPKLVPMSRQVIAACLAQVAAVPPPPRGKSHHEEEQRPAARVPLAAWVGDEPLSEVPELVADPSCLVDAAVRLWVDAEAHLSVAVPASIATAIGRAVSCGAMDEEAWAQLLAWAIVSARYPHLATSACTIETITAALQVAYLVRAAAHLRMVAPLTNAEAEEVVARGVQLLVEAQRRQHLSGTVESPAGAAKPSWKRNVSYASLSAASRATTVAAADADNLIGGDDTSSDGDRFVR